MEREVRAGGQSVCRELTGHGIGRRIHEEPRVPNHYVAQLTRALTDGLVLTIEPIISAGSGSVHGGTASARTGPAGCLTGT